MVTIGKVWDRTTGYLGDNARALMPYILLAMFVPNAISGAIKPLMAEPAGATKAIAGLATVALALVSLWGQLTVTALAIEPPAGASAASRLATRRFLPVIGVSLVVGIVVAAMFVIPALIVLAASGVDFAALAAHQRPDLSAGAVIFLVFYILLWIVLGLWIGARIFLLSPTILAERRGLGAIARSFVLSRDIVWKLIGVEILYGVVAGVAALAAQTVVGSILRLALGGDGLITAASVVTAIVVAAVATLFAVLLAAFLGKLYVAAREAHASVEAPV